MARKADQIHYIRIESKGYINIPAIGEVFISEIEYEYSNNERFAYRMASRYPETSLLKMFGQREDKATLFYRGKYNYYVADNIIFCDGGNVRVMINMDHVIGFNEEDMIFTDQYCLSIHEHSANKANVCPVDGMSEIVQAHKRVFYRYQMSKVGVLLDINELVRE